MPGAHSKREIEIKLRLSGAAEGRRLLRKAGFTVIRRRLFESNIVFDAEDARFRKRGVLLRLRQSGRDTTLTYKGPSAPSRYKSRHEVEVPVPDSKRLRQILEFLGYKPVFRYQKYRSEHRQGPGGGLVTVDETPIGTFLELEGPPRWIDRTARSLGFSELDYITDSYEKLYMDFRRQTAKAPCHMVFGGTHLAVGDC